MSSATVYWLECVSEELPLDLEWLSRNELERFQQLRIPKRRADWLLGRWTAKHALAKVLGMVETRSLLRCMEIIPDETGAPRPVVNGFQAPASLSLSHRGGRALAVVGSPGQLIGCDLELSEPRSREFIDDFFTAEEVQQLELCGDRYCTNDTATLIWSAKESVLKALKVGLRMDTRRISVNIRFEPLDSPQWRQFCAAIADGPTFFGAWVRADGWIRSIASCSSPLPYLSELSH